MKIVFYMYTYTHINTCSEAEIGSPSLYQLKCIGISPDVTEHVACALPPSWRLVGNENGSKMGGLCTISCISLLATSPSRLVT